MEETLAEIEARIYVCETLAAQYVAMMLKLQNVPPESMEAYIEKQSILLAQADVAPSRFVTEERWKEIVGEAISRLLRHAASNLTTVGLPSPAPTDN